MERPIRSAEVINLFAARGALVDMIQWSDVWVQELTHRLIGGTVLPNVEAAASLDRYGTSSSSTRRKAGEEVRMMPVDIAKEGGEPDMLALFGD